MAWIITVDFTDGREQQAVKLATPSLGPAVESALHKMGLSSERVGSYQITVTQPGPGMRY
jgi:hypothetical protein